MKSSALRFLLSLLFLTITAAPVRAGLPPRTLLAFNPFFGNDDSVSGTGLVQAPDGNLYGVAALSGDFGFGSIFQITPAGKVATFVSFNSAVTLGAQFGNLIVGADGNLYGTGPDGDAHGFGALFRVTPDGVISNLASFENFPGIGPGPLTQGVDSNFYGVTTLGGTNGAGMIYKVTPAGMVTPLYSFTNGVDGATPQGPLLQGTNGLLYGTASAGGTTADSSGSGGVFFSISTNGLFTVLASLGASGGANPSGALAFGTDGNVYGSAPSGFVFQLTPGGGLTVLSHLAGVEGDGLPFGLISGNDGNFYGVASQGGQYGFGTLFRVTPAGVLTTLHSFKGTDGSFPNCLTLGADGNFYGTTRSTVFKMTATGVVTTLVNPGPSAPQKFLHGQDGIFYGTTYVGGDFGQGTAFRISPVGVFAKLASFNGASNLSGPSSGFIEAGNGEFYGTAAGGGVNGGGSIFKMTRAGKVTVLHTFGGAPPYYPQGSAPSSLIQGANGDFYGTTLLGGSPADQSAGYGTIFKMTPRGVLTTLVSFEGTNGANPASLIQARDHDFYGMTLSMSNGPIAPSVFKMTPAGKLTTVFSFGGSNGPPQTLLQGRNGDFYGTTGGNGSNLCGTVFRLATNGVLTNIISFDATNGFTPTTLVQSPDGNLYCGTEFNGGSNLSHGAIFRINSSNNVLRVAQFTGPDGANPAQLAPLRDGRLFGVTSAGGLKGGGTIFELGRVSYAGLFYDTNNPNAVSSGFFRITVALDLKFGGAVKIGGHTHLVVGHFDSETLAGTATVRRNIGSFISLALQLSPDGDSITGTASDGHWTVPLSGESSADYDASNPSPDADKYNFLLSGGGGGGSGGVLVTSNGVVTLGGVLGDHAAISQQTYVAKNETWPLYVSLYHGKGVLTGWVTFTNQLTSQFNGNVIWTQDAHVSRNNPGGFTNVLSIQGLLR